ncbi:MAG: efflux RND transporter permease subunit [Pseudomonadota bacterium]
MLTQLALRNRTLTLAALIVAMVWGGYNLLTHPSREDPAITIRSASVIVRFPGMSAPRIEDLITTKIEEKVREIPEVDEIVSISTTGQSLVKITVADDYTDMAPIWANLRNKMDDVVPDLPDGSIGPLVEDDEGNVAFATIAMTADGFSNAEIYEAAKAYRRIVYARVDGVRKVEFYGYEEQRIFVEFDNVQIARLGLSPDSIRTAISQQNVILPGGRIEADGKSFTIEPSGDFDSVEDIRQISLAVPGSSAPIYLADIARITPGYQEPPGKPAFWNGKPALVVSVSMVGQFDANAFSKQLNDVTTQFEANLPVGYVMERVTWQADEISTAILSVFNNLWQTILIVLVVVVAFLGFRTGLIVGAMVPLVMIISTIVMRMTGIELERMSLASLIIALGLLVDNGIVIAEDLQNRLKQGEERLSAALATGQAMTVPLLAASLTTILAFMPLMLAPGGAGEYTRSISLVIAIALITSWVVALTVLILFCVWFLKGGEAIDENVVYDKPMYNAYRSFLGLCLQWRYVTLAVAFSSLFAGAGLFQFVASTFFPASERTQLQIIVELPQGHNTYATRAVTQRIETWLQSKEINPEVENVVTYIADGGPRFYLALSPPDGTPNTAYMLVLVKSPEDVRALQEKVRRFTADAVPEAEIYPKVMSMGPNEAGLVEYRIAGPDETVLKQASDQLQLALRRIPGTVDVTDDWKNPTVTIRAVIDQDAARRAGITSQDIANALNNQLSGAEVTDYRVGDLSIPVVFRTKEDQRTRLNRLMSLNIGITGTSPVTLEQVARLEPDPGFSKVRRRDLERVITISAKNLGKTAAELDGLMVPELASLEQVLPKLYRIERGGEIENSSDAQGRLFANVPLAFALMILVLIWQFDSFRKPLIIILTIPLVFFGVSLSLLAMPGANFSFMGILGLLALAGIVINNAIVLIDRIDVERDRGRDLQNALIEAGVRRFQPIVMTTCTTALGLLPIILSRDVLFYDLAVVIAGGLIVGTVLTLVVVPCLFAIFFRDEPTARA